MGNSGIGEFVQVGGRLVVDLLNTVGSRHGQPVELLTDHRELAGWAGAVGVPYGPELALVSPEAVAHLREFREALREGLERWRSGEPPMSSMIGRLNRELARDPRHVVLEVSDGRIVTGLVSTGPALDRLYADLAGSAAMMLGRDSPARYRPCANESCRLMFYDDSKPGTRRWCSMERCGGRAKARTFRLRHADVARS